MTRARCRKVFGPDLIIRTPNLDFFVNLWYIDVFAKERFSLEQ